jgi:hypothetical protein
MAYRKRTIIFNPGPQCEGITVTGRRCKRCVGIQGHNNLCAIHDETHRIHQGATKTIMRHRRHDNRWPGGVRGHRTGIIHSRRPIDLGHYPASCFGYPSVSDISITTINYLNTPVSPHVNQSLSTRGHSNDEDSHVNQSLSTRGHSNDEESFQTIQPDTTDITDIPGYIISEPAAELSGDVFITPVTIDEDIASVSATDTPTDYDLIVTDDWFTSTIYGVDGHR